MKKIIYLAFLLLAITACSNDKGSVIGTASANGGAIISGITVQLFTMSNDLYTTTTTDSQGNFIFSDIENGNYYIAATVVSGADTYDTGNAPRIVYVSDEIVKEVALSLSKK